jgi:hypothetical protein
MGMGMAGWGVGGFDDRCGGGQAEVGCAAVVGGPFAGAANGQAVVNGTFAGAAIGQAAVARRLLSAEGGPVPEPATEWTTCSAVGPTGRYGAGSRVAPGCVLGAAAASPFRCRSRPPRWSQPRSSAVGDPAGRLGSHLDGAGKWISWPRVWTDLWTSGPSVDNSGCGRGCRASEVVKASAGEGAAFG